MYSLYANTINETEKILQKKKTLAYLTISAIIPAGAAVIISLFQSKLGIFSFTSNSFPVLILGIFTAFLLPLFVFSAAADVFAGERGDKSLKITLTRPISRFNVFLSKNIALGLYIIINLFIVFIISVISALFLNGSFQIGAGFFQSLLAYLVAVFPMLCLSILAAFLAQFFRNSSGALTTAIFIYIAGKVVPILFPQAAKILPFNYTDWHLLWLGSTVGPGRLLNVFMIFVSYGLIFLGAGYYFFDKKDV